MQIDTGIMPGVEISYQFHSCPQTAATDVKQPVMRHESLRDQKVELKLANFLPEPANTLTMPSGPHLRLYGGFIVVAAGHHPLLTLLARPATRSRCSATERGRIMFS